MGLYEELYDRKGKGEILRFEDLSAEDLKQLYIDENKTDGALAQLFNIKPSRVTYERRKFGITIRDSVLDEYLLGKTERSKKVNAELKKEILKIDNIDVISKAITHFAFRNGPIEDMHASPNNQLTDSDMKILNIYMVNRLAYIFTLIVEERWVEFDFLVKTNGVYGGDWDKAEPDDGGNRKIIEMLIDEKR